MKKLFATLSAGLFSLSALAQTYPSPTFNRRFCLGDPNHRARIRENVDPVQRLGLYHLQQRGRDGNRNREFDQDESYQLAVAGPAMKFWTFPCRFGTFARTKTGG
jgi:hypothetical protein